MHISFNLTTTFSIAGTGSLSTREHGTNGTSAEAWLRPWTTTCSWRHDPAQTQPGHGRNGRARARQRGDRRSSVAASRRKSPPLLLSSSHPRRSRPVGPVYFTLTPLNFDRDYESRSDILRKKNPVFYKNTPTLVPDSACYPLPMAWPSFPLPGGKRRP